MGPSAPAPAPGHRPSLARAPSDGPRRQSSWWASASAATLVVVLLAVLGYLLAAAQAQTRADLEQRLLERAEIVAGVAESVLDASGSAHRLEALRRFAGERIRRADLDAVVVRRNLAYARVLDRDGDVLAASSGAPPRGTGAAPHVAAALGGRPAASGVVHLGARRNVVELATSYPALGGTRVLVAAMRGEAVAQFLSLSLASVPPLGGARAYVLDGAGRVVGTPTGAHPGSPLGDPALLRAVRTRQDGAYGEDRYFASAPVGMSSWRVVIRARRSELYAPVRGPRGWVPWIVFGALSLAAIAIVLLLRRGAVSAWRLRQANRQLARSIAALRDAQTVGHIGSWEWDVESDRLTWSDELYRIFGRTRATFDGSYEAYAACVHPADRQRAKEVVRRAIERREPYSIEERIVRPDGEERVLHSRGEPVVDGGGRVVRLIGVCQDVTERRRAEAAAAEAEERFRKAFEHGSVGMALLGTEGDSRGRFLNVNPALCEIASRSRAELVGRAARRIVHSEDRPQADAALARLLAGTSRTERLELRCMRPDGEAVWVDVSASLARDGEGRPLYAVLQLQDVDERKRFEGQLRYLADHDPLTGLLNRRGFTAELETHVDRAARYGGTGAVLMVDLDHFKYVNDTLGHAVGDDLLGHVAESLRERLRASDVVARLGGDEFAVILPHASEEEAVRVATDVCATLRDAALASGPEGSSRLTASVGVALFGEGHALEAERALVDADIAMYQAKQNGRDRVEALAGAEVEQSRMKSHLAWTQAIRDAIADDRFLLHAQPILDLRTGEIARHELLLRMVGLDGELIPPAAFLGIAERSGLMQAIDRLVIRRAIGMLAASEDAGAPAIVQVNLSGTSVTDPDVLELAQREVIESGIDARRLVFEITETAAIVNIDRAKRFASAVGALGCTIALDDFGAGFGSFYYLKHVPFDCLKIDGEFIRSLARSRSDQVTVQAMVDVAHSLGKQVIAEFVEDEQTLAMLREYGVDYAQGYHVGEPCSLPPRDLVRTGAGG